MSFVKKPSELGYNVNIRDNQGVNKQEYICFLTMHDAFDFITTRLPKDWSFIPYMAQQPETLVLIDKPEDNYHAYVNIEKAIKSVNAPSYVKKKIA